MIRSFRNADVNRVIWIWLDANIEAHNFISAGYWRDNFESVRRMLPRAEVYVYEDNGGEIQGFVGLDGCYICGIFVRCEMRSRGIGKRLLDYVKEIRPSLSLRVYCKNGKAVHFYQREGFHTVTENIDNETKEQEYFMVWQGHKIDRLANTY